MPNRTRLLAGVAAAGLALLAGPWLLIVPIGGALALAAAVEGVLR